MLKTEKISAAEADTECTMAFKECSIFQLAIPVLQVQREVLTWEDKSLSGQSPFTEKWKSLNCTKMWGIDVLFSWYWVSNLAPIPQS